MDITTVWRRTLESSRRTQPSANCSTAIRESAHAGLTKARSAFSSQTSLQIMAVVKNVEESVLYLLEDILHNYYVKRLCIIYLIMMKMSQTKPRKRTRIVLPYSILEESSAVPVPEDCTDTRWKWFKGCLGALDGTHINVMVGNADKPRYRTRKGQIATNTLAACDRNMRFTYVLPGWEGSAGDARVLRDAVNRRHGLRVPVGKYYLCDNGPENAVGHPPKCLFLPNQVEEQADTDFVNTVEATNAWQLQRDELALAMWNHEQLAQ
ncbi:protein ANTAGONIST OF LIKE HETEROCHROMATIN PROTEIN 1-like isoform X1 [Salvia divinorum]|uniref:Protein ANTAGONIST OF LIKE HETEROCHROMATIN PROTEIN 1-like isoform X1 n=1 Tax=Salvia divinorum TaxID=28513 RepID=A0ABD1H2V1_SALDI